MALRASFPLRPQEGNRKFVGGTLRYSAGCFTMVWLLAVCLSPWVVWELREGGSGLGCLP